MQSTARFLTTIAVISAWLAISNHCALGVAAPTETKTAANECPFHSNPPAPVKQKQASDSPCCKILRAIPAKNSANAIVDLAHIDLSFANLVVIAPPKVFFTAQTLDTGPPGKTSFAELIRSMRAHAPPSLA